MGLLVLAMLVLYVIAASLLLEAGIVLDLVGRRPRSSWASPSPSRTASFEQAEQRRIREAIGRYLSPSVSRWVLADPIYCAWASSGR